MTSHLQREMRWIAVSNLQRRQMARESLAWKMAAQASSPTEHRQEIEASLMQEANRAVADAIMEELVA